MCEEVAVFNYENKEFDYNCTGSNSELESLIESKWLRAMEDGFFNYKLEFESKVLPGKRFFYVLLLPNRIQKRRKPHIFHHCNTPFDPSAFNFTMVKQEEVLFTVVEEWEEHPHQLLINTSPLAPLHSLLCARVNAKLNQTLDIKGIDFALRTLLFISNPNFVVGFNSLCAAASVNHQHFHIWKCATTLFIQSAPVTQTPYPNIFLLISPPINAFAFQVREGNFHDVCSSVHKVTEYLLSKNIPYNLHSCRCKSFDSSSSSSSSSHNYVSVFIFPRKSILVDKLQKEEDLNFGIACAEVAGFVPVYDEQTYKTVTEEKIEKEIEKHLMGQEEIQHILIDMMKS